MNDVISPLKEEKKEDNTVLYTESLLLMKSIKELVEELKTLRVHEEKKQ